MSVYARLEAAATRLIAQYGKAGKLWRITTSGPAHNPTVTEDDHDITLVETGYSLTNRNETLVLAGDKLGIISTAGEAPIMADKIEIDGIRYSFVDISPLNPGGTTLMWEIHARQ